MPKTNGSGQARVLSPAQLDELIEAAPSPAYRACWAVMRYTGSRISETLLLRWGAVHDDRITFCASTTKTKRTREPIMALALQEELRQFREWWQTIHQSKPTRIDLLFPSPGSKTTPLSRQAVDRALRITSERLGMPSGISLHSFRRSLATTMAQRGASLRTVQSFTGHRSLGQLQNYIDVRVEDQLAALELIH
jgi:integrase/recombinase XerD